MVLYHKLIARTDDQGWQFSFKQFRLKQLPFVRNRLVEMGKKNWGTNKKCERLRWLRTEKLRNIIQNRKNSSLSLSLAICTYVYACYAIHNIPVSSEVIYTIMPIMFCIYAHETLGEFYVKRVSCWEYFLLWSTHRLCRERAYEKEKQISG